MAVQADHSLLEIADADTWEDLAVAQEDLVSGRHLRTSESLFFSINIK